MSSTQDSRGDTKGKNEYFRCTHFMTFKFIDVTKQTRVTKPGRICDINSIVFK